MSKCECKNCINYNACEEWDKRYNGSNSGFPYECEEDTEACPFFKDKSLCVELPSIRYSKIHKCWLVYYIVNDCLQTTLCATEESAKEKLREVGE